jgi:seryl-tRNA synthetase
VSLARSLVAIIENYQNQNGGIIVPEVLKPYMGGKDSI